MARERAAGGPADGCNQLKDVHIPLSAISSA
jgi:hypothetical protein